MLAVARLRRQRERRAPAPATEAVPAALHDPCDTPNECNSKTVTCPPDYYRKVDCTFQGACAGGVFNCPAGHDCAPLRREACRGGQACMTSGSITCGADVSTCLARRDLRQQRLHWELR